MTHKHTSSQIQHVAVRTSTGRNHLKFLQAISFAQNNDTDGNSSWETRQYCMAHIRKCPYFIPGCKCCVHRKESQCPSCQVVYKLYPTA